MKKENIFNGFIKWLFRIGAGVIVVILILSAFAFFLKADKPSSVDNAPWGIQTYTNDKFRIPSRYYYAEGIEYKQGVLTIVGSWWSWDGRKYHRHNDIKQFPEKECGKVDVIRRG